MTVKHLTEPELSELADELFGAVPPLDESRQRIAVGLYRLLAEGEPVSDERLAAAAAVPLEEVRAALREWPGVYRDGDGGVIGFWGLTVSEMPPHAFHVGGKTLWTWCSWDSLFIPAVLGTTAQVESVCATTGEKVTATVGPDGVHAVSPPTVVISFVRPDGKLDHDVILSFCHYVLYFSSPEAGARWVNGRAGAFLLSLEQGFELGRLVFQRKLAAALRPASSGSSRPRGR